MTQVLAADCIASGKCYYKLVNHARLSASAHQGSLSACSLVDSELATAHGAQIEWHGSKFGAPTAAHLAGPSEGFRLRVNCQGHFLTLKSGATQACLPPSTLSLCNPLYNMDRSMQTHLLRNEAETVAGSWIGRSRCALQDLCDCRS